MRLRRLPSFQWGQLELFHVNEHIFSFMRKALDNPMYLVVMNFSESMQNINLISGTSFDKVEKKELAVLYYISGFYKEMNNNFDETAVCLIEKYKKTGRVNIENFDLNSFDCLILTSDF